METETVEGDGIRRGWEEAGKGQPVIFLRFVRDPIENAVPWPRPGKGERLGKRLSPMLTVLLVDLTSVFC